MLLVQTCKKLNTVTTVDFGCACQMSACYTFLYRLLSSSEACLFTLRHPSISNVVYDENPEWSPLSLLHHTSCVLAHTSARQLQVYGMLSVILQDLQ